MHRLVKQFYLVLACLVLSACSQNETQFSEFPGFATYLENFPPTDTLPSAKEKALLQQYRPRVFMAEGQTRFLDFYADYIAHGELYDKGQLVSKAVTPQLLNQYKDSFQAEFRHKPHSQKSSPTIYGRVDYDTLKYQDQQFPLTFLSYNLAFAHSGLLKGLASWQRVLMGIVGDNSDWHQLDHYVGMSVALYADKPVAVLLQQHNYQTVWLLDTKAKNSELASQSVSDSIIALPQDNRISVDVAMQSNELYLHSPELVKHPSVSFIGEENLEFIKTGKNMPTMAGFDITHGQQEQEYTLKFLPTSDAFYTFKGRLGEKRGMPGRDGPPGAQYVTLPSLLPWSNRFVTGFRPGTVAEETAKIATLFAGEKFEIEDSALDQYRQDFIDAMTLLLAD